MIEVKNLVKRYGDHTAVDNLSFTVEKGQIYGFLGPNGAGKSTTMNIITGYIAPTEGTVTVDGHDTLKDAAAARRCIGYLPEMPPLYTDMTVGEYLKFVTELKEVKKGERRDMMDKVMEMTGITDAENRVIKNLSKGYRQRVGLAQALVGFPEILILDEPTVGLDPKQMIEIRELIRDLSKDHTVILSSHILSEVSAVCDHILIISKGKLVASDTPENLSKAMAGNQKLSLLVKGDGEEVRDIVQEIDGISECSVTASDEEGLVNVEIDAQPQCDVREAVFFAMAGSGKPILEMKTTNMSLEEVFMELTENGAEYPEAGEEDGGANEDTEAGENADADEDTDENAGADEVPGAKETAARAYESAVTSDEAEEVKDNEGDL